MSPPIHRDWWLAAAITGAALPAAQGQPATGAARQPAGVVTTSEPGRTTTTTLYSDGNKGQVLTTGPNQTMHVLFPDQSAITVGPNSQVTIADYQYNQQTKDGRILIDMTKGLMRVVGGFISKKNDTQVRTATATVGIRGGITVVETNGQQTQGTFLFGQQMQMSNNNGQSQFVNRAGFGLSTNGNDINPPQRVNIGDLTRQFGQGTPGGGGQQPGGQGGGQGGGTLPTGQQTFSNLNPDRLQNNQGPGGQPGSNNQNPTLNQILGNSRINSSQS